jgi:hypothetical protein
MQTQAIAKAKHGKSAAKPGVKPAAKTQIAFLFDEGGPTEKEVLGGKGAGLVELVQMDVPVPAGFTLTTAVARAYAQHGVVPKRPTSICAPSSTSWSVRPASASVTASAPCLFRCAPALPFPCRG